MHPSLTGDLDHLSSSHVYIKPKSNPGTENNELMITPDQIDQPPPNINRIATLMCLDPLPVAQRQLEAESDQT